MDCRFPSVSSAFGCVVSARILIVASHAMASLAGCSRTLPPIVHLSTAVVCWYAMLPFRQYACAWVLPGKIRLRPCAEAGSQCGISIGIRPKPTPGPSRQSRGLVACVRMSDCCAWKLRWQLPPAIGSMRMRSRLPSGPFVPVMTGAAMGQSRLLKGLKLVPEAQARVG